MQTDDFMCDVCESEFTIEHYGDDVPCFCPFCGESLFVEPADQDDEESDEE